MLIGINMIIWYLCCQVSRTFPIYGKSILKFQTMRKKNISLMSLARYTAQKISGTTAALLGVRNKTYCHHLLLQGCWTLTPKIRLRVGRTIATLCISSEKKRKALPLRRMADATADSEHHCQPAASQTLHNGVCHSPRPYAVTDGAHLSADTNTHK